MIEVVVVKVQHRKSLSLGNKIKTPVFFLKINKMFYIERGMGTTTPNLRVLSTPPFFF